jgi:hypothetical protein
MCSAVLGLLALGAPRLVAAAPPAGPAPGPRTAALVSVTFAGTFDRREQAELQLALRRALAGAGLQLFEAEQLDLALGGRRPESCQDDRCRIEVARALGAQRLVDAVFRREAGGVGVSLFMFNALVSERTATATRFCARCSLGGFRITMSEAAGALCASDPAVPAGRLVVRTIPGGATVTLDGRMLGESDADLPVAAGGHLLVLERPGFARVDVKVEVKANEASRIELALAATTPASQTASVEPGRRALRPWAYGLIGLGGAALATGVVLYALGCEPEGEVRRCPRLPSVRTSGTVLLVSGAAAVAGGVVLLAWDGRRERGRVTATPGGVALTVSWE